jgi:hypothetical protein
VFKTLQEPIPVPKPAQSPQFLEVPIPKASRRDPHIGDFGFRPIDLDTGLEISPKPSQMKENPEEHFSTEVVFKEKEQEAVSWKRPVLPTTSLFASSAQFQGKKSHASESEESFLSYALRGQEKEPSKSSEGGLQETENMRKGSSSQGSLSAQLPELPHFLNDLTTISGFAPLEYVLPAVADTWKLLSTFPFATLPLDPEPPTVVMKWIHREDAYYRGYLNSEQQYAGFGVLITRDSITEGQWTRGGLHGLGRRVTLDTILTGYWVENTLSGFGTCFDLRPKSLYSGDWNESQPEGIGCLSSPTQLYKGSFHAGRKSGQGRIITAELQYEGEFQEGEIAGFGRAVLKDGAQYVGLWVHGVPQGLGVHSTADRKLFYGDHKAGKGVSGLYLVKGEPMKAI